MAVGMEARGSGRHRGRGRGSGGLREAWEELPAPAMNWLVVVLGAVVIGCGLMMVAALRLLDFEVSSTSQVPVLMRATFEGSADPFPSAAEDGYTTSIDGGVYRLTSTATGGASGVRTAGLSAAAAVVEISADVSRAPDAAAGATAGTATGSVAGVACLDESGGNGYALLADGSGNVTLARAEGGRLAPLTQTQQPATSTTRLQLTCGDAGTAADTTRLTAVVDGVSVLETTDAGAQMYAQAGLVAITGGPGAAASFDDVLVLVPSAF